MMGAIDHDSGFQSDVIGLMNALLGFKDVQSLRASLPGAAFFWGGSPRHQGKGDSGDCAAQISLGSGRSSYRYFF
jgi:hypothetical protein